LLSLSSFGPFEDASQARRENHAGYFQLLSTIGRVSLQGGIRADDNERFGDFVTYRAGAALQLSDAVRARASAGTGFKEPRFYEQFATGFVVGNPNLVPETSRSLEAGADVDVGAASFAATIFRQTYKNLIQYASAAPGEPNYRNVGRVASDGIELESQWMQDAWTLRASLTLLDTEVKDAGTGSDPLYLAGESLIRRPRQTASLAANYGNTFNVGAVISFTGKRDDLYYDETFTPQRIELPNYTKVDFMARTPAFSGIRGALKIENVFDESYEEVFNFPARGRVVFIGVTVDR
jgi:vitamin B12 transporter